MLANNYDLTSSESPELLYATLEDYGIAVRHFRFTNSCAARLAGTTSRDPHGSRIETIDDNQIWYSVKEAAESFMAVLQIQRQNRL